MYPQPAGQQASVVDVDDELGRTHRGLCRGHDVAEARGSVAQPGVDPVPHAHEGDVGQHDPGVAGVNRPIV